MTEIIAWFVGLFFLFGFIVYLRYEFTDVKKCETCGEYSGTVGNYSGGCILMCSKCVKRMNRRDKWHRVVKSWKLNKKRSK